MKEWKNVMLDDSSMWPKEGMVDLDPAHTDDRGYIQSLVNFPVKNVSIIFSEKGSVRSNHYHLTDWHYMYVLSGSFDYYYRPTGSEQELSRVSVKENEMIFTPPMEDHATVFLEDSRLIVMSRNPRDQESYEADTRRIMLIEPGKIPVV